MKLYEFIGVWKSEYTSDEVSTYTVLHGDDRNDWPEKTPDESPIIIDMDEIVAANEWIENEVSNTVVECKGSARYRLKVPFKFFRGLLHNLHPITKVDYNGL